MSGFQPVFPLFQYTHLFGGFTRKIGLAALACDLGAVHEPSLVNHIDGGAVLVVGDTDPRGFRKNVTFDVLLDLLTVPALFIFQDSDRGTTIRKLCMRAFTFMRYRRSMVVWPVLDRGPAVVGCAVVGVVALDEPTEGVRLGLIERLRARKEDVGGVDGGGVDAADEEEEGLEALVDERRWRREWEAFGKDLWL